MMLIILSVLQICAWNRFGWNQSTNFINDHGNALSPRHNSVKFHQDQRHMLVVHESCLATLEGPNLELRKQVSANYLQC